MTRGIVIRESDLGVGPAGSLPPSSPPPSPRGTRQTSWWTATAWSLGVAAAVGAGCFFVGQSTRQSDAEVRRALAVQQQQLDADHAQDLRAVEQQTRAQLGSSFRRRAQARAHAAELAAETARQEGEATGRSQGYAAGQQVGESTGYQRGLCAYTYILC